MSEFTGKLNAREILAAFANVQRQQDGIRKAKSGLSGDLMALAVPYAVTDDKEYARCVNEEERESRALSLANMFSEYLKPVEDEFKKRENAKLPGAWTQAKSDIKAAIKLQLDLSSFGSFDELKKAKLKAAKDAKGEQDSGESDSAETGSDDGQATIETDSPILHELLGQFANLMNEAIQNGKESEVENILEDACIRLALASEDDSLEHEAPRLAQVG